MILVSPTLKVVLRPIVVAVLLALMESHYAMANESKYDNEIQFNTDVLDVKDRSHIDLQEFSRAGYIMPGKYHMVLRVNKHEFKEQEINFIVPPDDPKGSVPCLTPEITEQLGIKDAKKSSLTWWNNGHCLNLDSLPGTHAQGNLGDNALDVSIPQAYIEYIADNWDPPSRWDEGIPGGLFDYNVNGRTIRSTDTGQNEQSVSGNGVFGANYGPWRLRADWQGQYDHVTGKQESAQKSFRMSRYYMYRAVPSLGAKLTLGENYLYSDVFDSFRFMGASLITDDSMLPPNLRGYAPEVSGVAKTDAKVTISQQGRVIYEAQVSAGPFRIQDLSSAVSGKLDVKVREQDGSEQTFQVNTASIPYLTRPGLVRYKVSMGKPSDYQRHSEGPGFGSGEFSWGINNGWSLYGGALVGGDYNALSMGLGRDLLSMGALSVDVTQSRAQFPTQATKIGQSYRVSYSKRFEELNSQVTFAGYRFSEQDYMSMSQYLDARYHSNSMYSNKELYTIMLNKQFDTLGLSTYLNYSHQTYWNYSANDSYNMSISRYFGVGRIKNISVSLTGYRTVYNGTNDDGAYISVMVPWGTSGTISYDSQYYNNNNSQSVSLNNRIDKSSTYQITAGTNYNGKGNASGYYAHDGDVTSMTANAGYSDGQYSSLGMTLQGGLTATAKGVVLHRISTLGGTRMMVDTNGVSKVPVRGNGGTNYTNSFGKAVVSDLNSYYRSSVNVDINKLADNVDAPRSVVQGALTEGAIGYRKFGIIAGEKAMGVIKLSDGTSPPFGAVVVSKEDYQTGIINDDGSVWLIGIKPGETMKVKWEGKVQCQIHLPIPLPPLSNGLLLPCERQQLG